jgi:hypothetical protein
MSQKIYQPHNPVRNCGFYIVAASIIAFMLSVAFLVLSVSAPGWPVWLVVFSIVMVLWLLSLVLISRFLKNEPRRVILTDGTLIVENKNGQREAEIPFTSITAVYEAKSFIVNPNEPQYEKYKVWHRGLVIDWLENGEEHRHTLSERNTTEFDDLMDEVFARSPEKARGPRFYER